MDLAATRERLTATYQRRRTQARDLIDQVPILGRLVSEFIRIEVIDRCMLIAAQGLLALIPMLVVLAVVLPAPDRRRGPVVLRRDRRRQLRAGRAIEGEVTTDQVRAQTGIVGLADHARLGDQLRAGDPADVREGLGAAARRRGRPAPAAASSG